MVVECWNAPVENLRHHSVLSVVNIIRFQIFGVVGGNDSIRSSKSSK